MVFDSERGLAAQKQIDGAFAPGAFIPTDLRQVQAVEAIHERKLSAELLKDGSSVDTGFFPGLRKKLHCEHLRAGERLRGAFKNEGLVTLHVDFEQIPGLDSGALQKIVEPANRHLNKSLAAFQINHGMAAAISRLINAELCSALGSADGAGVDRDVGDAVAPEVFLEKLAIQRFRLDGNNFSGWTSEFTEEAGKVADVGAEVEEVPRCGVLKFFEEEFSEARLMNLASIQAAADGVALVAANLKTERKGASGDGSRERIGAFGPVGDAAQFVKESLVQEFT